jgi:predicted GIY-YIG superfamily endonuclease
MDSWYVYILECGDGSLYVGIAEDVERRVAAHSAGRGAKFTRGRRPLRVVYAEAHPDKPSARRREIELKGWRREKKLSLIGGFPSSP